MRNDLCLAATLTVSFRGHIKTEWCSIGEILRIIRRFAFDTGMHHSRGVFPRGIINKMSATEDSTKTRGCGSSAVSARRGDVHKQHVMVTVGGGEYFLVRVK